MVLEKIKHFGTWFSNKRKYPGVTFTVISKGFIVCCGHVEHISNHAISVPFYILQCIQLFQSVSPQSKDIILPFFRSSRCSSACLCALSWTRLWNEGLYPLSAHASQLPHSQQHGQGRGSYEISNFHPVSHSNTNGSSTASLSLWASAVRVARHGWTRLGCAWFAYGNEK